MKKLKNRLDAFSDAIIAIIITIMVLNLHTFISNDLNAYLNLAKEIGIYLISFFYVANMWYQHATVFNEIDTINYRIIIFDFIFLSGLSLMPIATSLMANNTTQINVIIYGLLSVAIYFLFRRLAKTIIHLKYVNKTDMQNVYIKIYGTHNQGLLAINVAVIILALIKPTWAVIFYLGFPIFDFLINSDDRQEMYDVEQLTPEQRADFLTFDAAGRKAFRQQQQKIAALAQENLAAGMTTDSSPAVVDESTATSTTSQAATSAAETRPRTPRSSSPNPHAPNQPNHPQQNRHQNYWQQWLDSNPDVRENVTNRLNAHQGLTREQKEQWAAWFKQRRQQMHQRPNRSNQTNHHN